MTCGGARGPPAFGIPLVMATRQRTLRLTHHGAETPDYPYMMFTEYPKGGSSWDSMVSIRPSDWQDMGEPRTITVTIEPATDG